MIPGIGRKGNIVALALFSIIISIPVVMGPPIQPYLHAYGIFMGGMAGAAWGRGVQAELTAHDYAVAFMCLSILDALFVLPRLIG